MPDRDRVLTNEPDGTLAAVLRALPVAAPPADLWPGIARAHARRSRRRAWRYGLPVALAAALVCAVLVPRGTPSQRSPIAFTPAAAIAPQTDAVVDELADLRDRSRTLDRWIAAVAARAPQNSRDLMAAVEIEDLIGLVDLQLGAAHGNGESLPLWRQRVALLEDLATVRGSAWAIAASDERVRSLPSSRLN